MARGIRARDYNWVRGDVQTTIDGFPLINTPGKAWFVDGTTGGPTRTGESWENAVSTITLGLAKARDAKNDIIYIAPGFYNETVAVSKGMVTLVGIGGRGAVGVAPTTAGAEGMRVTAPDVTLINLGVAGDDTGDYGLNISGTIAVHADGVRRFRAFGCKFEAGSGAGKPAVLMDGNADDNSGDTLFYDCEFAWAGYGLALKESGFGTPTQVFLQKCWMHNIITSYIWDHDSSVGPTNLQVTDSVFDASEGGTEPTKHLDLVVGDGIFSGNRFAIATNATASLVIGANYQWVANATEAGWSTARPA